MKQNFDVEVNKRIEHLYRLETENTAELLLRLTGSIVGAGIVSSYAGWKFASIWVVLYCIWLGVFLAFLRNRRPKAAAVDIWVAYLLYTSLLALYMTLPTMMMASADQVLSLSGFCIFCGVVVFVVRRAEYDKWMTLIQICILAISLGIAIVSVIFREHSVLGRVGIIFAAAAFLFYLIQGAFLVRKQRMRVDDIAARSAEAEKLEAIGKLAGGVAHEFNNMLTVIHGNLDLIDAVDDPQLRHEFLQEARAATMRGASAIRQLLTYARKNDGTPLPHEIDILLAKTEQLCRAIVPPSVHLFFDDPTSGLVILVDEALFVAAVINLVKNSIDAVKDNGTITISVEVLGLGEAVKCISGQTLKRGTYLRIAVADDGPGIRQPSSNVSRSHSSPLSKWDRDLALVCLWWLASPPGRMDASASVRLLAIQRSLSSCQYMWDQELERTQFGGNEFQSEGG